MIVLVLALVGAMQSPAASPSPAMTPPPLIARPAAPPAPAAAPSAPAPAVRAAAAPAPAAAAVTPPTADAVVALVKQAPAFAGDGGRTGLLAMPEKQMPVPGVGDLGLFVEIAWTDKDGAAHTGLAVVAHESVQDVPWMIKAAPWGLVQVVENQTLAGAAAELKRARMIANESAAVRDIRTIYSAEMLFMAVADGSYGDLRCLNVPADCIRDIPGEQLLEKDVTVATERSGYRRKFHPGARVRSAKAKGAPSPFVKAFAYTAVPTHRGETGMRSFCGDSSGRVCVVEDGSDPKVVGGACTPCTEMKPSEFAPPEVKK